MVRFDSWRAVSRGNRADRNLATKSTIGGRAIWQAVICVKLEQASKAAMWTPTRRKIGEGGTNGEEPGAGARHYDNHRAPVRSTGVVTTSGAEAWSGLLVVTIVRSIRPQTVVLVVTIVRSIHLEQWYTPLSRISRTVMLRLWSSMPES